MSDVTLVGASETQNAQNALAELRMAQNHHKESRLRMTRPRQINSMALLYHSLVEGAGCHKPCQTCLMTPTQYDDDPKTKRIIKYVKEIKSLLDLFS